MTTVTVTHLPFIIVRDDFNAARYQEYASMCVHQLFNAMHLARTLPYPDRACRLRAIQFELALRAPVPNTATAH